MICLNSAGGLVRSEVEIGGEGGPSAVRLGKAAGVALTPAEAGGTRVGDLSAAEGCGFSEGRKTAQILHRAVHVSVCPPLLGRGVLPARPRGAAGEDTVTRSRSPGV